MLTEDGIMLNKDGAYMAAVTFRGPDLASSTGAILMVLRAQRNYAPQEPGLKLASACRGPARALAAQPRRGSLPDYISRLADEEQRRDFSRDDRFSRAAISRPSRSFSRRAS